MTTDFSDRKDAVVALVVTIIATLVFAILLPATPFEFW